MQILHHTKTGKLFKNNPFVNNITIYLCFITNKVKIFLVKTSIVIYKE